MGGISAQEITGELVLSAYRRAYPERVSAVTWSGEDWNITVGGETFYWAQGRLLPPSLRDRWESFGPYGYYRYPPEVPDPRDFSPEQVERLRSQGSAAARLNRAAHNGAFEAALYGGLTRGEVERNLKKIRFLGHNVTVHSLIVEPLDRVEGRIREAAAEDEEIAAFIAAISYIGAYNWREIQGTQRRSYHSWGLAVDIQPGRLGNKAIYWQWERERNEDWMLVPLERRWQPPEGVIRIFEGEGFTWGGKWALYDNMHFEFRPELHEINRLLALQSAGGDPADSPAVP
ncbi:MAG: M15 family metallopeptidase, partial [Spirochaetaceae bacterium]|nr:M15 family metallopeptidase [Spirochaetaceae bacterium]